MSVPSIIIIDDCKTFVEPLQTYLGKEGIEVFVAETIEEARSAYRENPDVDAISFDGQMPEKKGEPIDRTGMLSVNLAREIKQTFKGLMIAASGSYNSQLRQAGCTMAFDQKSELLNFFVHHFE